MILGKIPAGIRWSIFQENSRKLRYLTLLAFIISFIIESYTSTIDRRTPIFVLVMIIAGMSLFNIVFQALISLVVTISTNYIAPIWESGLNFNAPPHFFVLFLIQWFCYFIIGLIISYLIRVQINDQKNIRNFVKTLAKTLESKDSYTASHSLNVAKYSRIIAEKLNYSKSDCETIYIGALLHDIGKIGIKDSILNKPARLTNEEYAVIQQHPVIGFNMLKLIENFEQNKVLDMILYHHERYDGKGYPYGLKGEMIPKFAAIVSVADAFDAMNSSRIYRDGYDIDYSIKELIRNSGTQFNPLIVNTFINYLNGDGADIFFSGKYCKIV